MHSHKIHNPRFSIIHFILIVSISVTLAQDYNMVGDLNQDGEINIIDIIRTVNIILEVPPLPTDEELWAADTNIDGSIDIADIILMINYIFGDFIESCLAENVETEPCYNNFTQCCYPITSHEFEWEFDTYHNMSLPSVWEIEMVDEDNIWIVGLFNFMNPYEKYNTLHWNGNEWSFLQNMPSTYPFPPKIYAIEYFSEDDIWATVIIPMHWDGIDWTFYYLYDMGIFQEGDGSIVDIFGASSDNVHFISTTGAIVHYNGDDFTYLGRWFGDTACWVTGTQDGSHIFVSSVKLAGVGQHFSGILEFKAGIWDTLYYTEDLSPDNGPQYMDWGHVTYSDLFADTAYFATNYGTLKYNFITEEFVLHTYPWTNDNSIASPKINIQHDNDILHTYGNNINYHYNGIDWVADHTVANEIPYPGRVNFKGNKIIMSAHIDGVSMFKAVGNRNINGRKNEKE